MYESVIKDDFDNEVTLEYMTNHLENSRWFKITYYHKSQGKEVTRYGRWDSKCRAWRTKNNDIAICYLQVDDNNEAQGYRTATGITDIQGKPKEDRFNANLPIVWDNISRLDS